MVEKEHKKKRRREKEEEEELEEEEVNVGRSKPQKEKKEKKEKKVKKVSKETRRDESEMTMEDEAVVKKKKSKQKRKVEALEEESAEENGQDVVEKEEMSVLEQKRREKREKKRLKSLDKVDRDIAKEKKLQTKSLAGGSKQQVQAKKQSSQVDKETELESDDDKPVAIVKHSFHTEEADMAETPREAYEHVAPILRKLAEVLGKSCEDLRLYDPYFCAGAVKRNLKAVGFPNVYNENEDFYEMIAEQSTPEHDVVITNPPYSRDHIPKFLRWCTKNRKPWLMLVPNYVYMKDYYQQSLGTSKPMYLCPPGRYVYESPKGVANALGQVRKSGEHKTAPFHSFWYFDSTPTMASKELFKWWMNSKQGEDNKCRLCTSTDYLPDQFRDSFDPLRKRLPKHKRNQMKKTHSADGRPLCKQCGQVHGNCKHTRDS